MHGTFLVIFQVFHDFQSLWELCITITFGVKGSRIIAFVPKFLTLESQIFAKLFAKSDSNCSIKLLFIDTINTLMVIWT